jgi:hypothetical protein
MWCDKTKQLDQQIYGVGQNLIAEGLIADGVVDERGIEDVRATDLVGYKDGIKGAGGEVYLCLT